MSDDQDLEEVGVGCFDCGHAQPDMVLGHACDRCGGSTAGRLYRRRLASDQVAPAATSALAPYVQPTGNRTMRVQTVLLNGHKFERRLGWNCSRCGRARDLGLLHVPPCSGAA